ncbi:MAG: DUF721 domain-containing protein [Verrucomicrobiota bacterium JB022]|nr:DUF721 domain-containing protein [Verrucomicrobiota bacterium JB022]
MFYSRQVNNLLSNLKGLPEDESHSLDRGAKRLDSLMEVIFERHKIDQETPEETVMQNWARIVGARYAQRCAPTKIDTDGVLLVRVGNSIVRRELQFTEDRIMTALRSLPNCAHIEGVRFIAG